MPRAAGEVLSFRGSRVRSTAVNQRPATLMDLQMKKSSDCASRYLAPGYIWLSELVSSKAGNNLPDVVVTLQGLVESHSIVIVEAMSDHVGLFLFVVGPCLLQLAGPTDLLEVLLSGSVNCCPHLSQVLFA